MTIVVRQALRLGAAGWALVGYGMVRLYKACTEVWLGGAWHGVVWLGVVEQGELRQGRVWLGLARLYMVCTVAQHDMARCGGVRLGVMWQGLHFSYSMVRRCVKSLLRLCTTGKNNKRKVIKIAFKY